MSKKSNTSRKYPNTIQTLVTGICAKRKSKGISQYKLSENTGLTRNCIQQAECYEHLPELPTLFEIMLGLDFDEEEGKELFWNCLNAYREDKVLQQEQDKELAGAV